MQFKSIERFREKLLRFSDAVSWRFRRQAVFEKGCCVPQNFLGNCIPGEVSLREKTTRWIHVEELSFNQVASEVFIFGGILLFVELIFLQPDAMKCFFVHFSRKSRFPSYPWCLELFQIIRMFWRASDLHLGIRILLFRQKYFKIWFSRKNSEFEFHTIDLIQEVLPHFLKKRDFTAKMVSVALKANFLTTDNCL